jgi:hypothetical protein
MSISKVLETRSFGERTLYLLFENAMQLSYFVDSVTRIVQLLCRFFSVPYKANM